MLGHDPFPNSGKVSFNSHALLDKPIDKIYQTNYIISLATSYSPIHHT